jgi:hypothetical protein
MWETLEVNDRVGYICIGGEGNSLFDSEKLLLDSEKYLTE